MRTRGDSLLLTIAAGLWNAAVALGFMIAVTLPALMP
jgi:hypothetical protein